MPYHIEVLATKEHLYKSIQVACDSLNKVQNEFIFLLPSNRLRKESYSFVQEKYSTKEVFNWLDRYRESAKGNRPFIVLVIDGFLFSEGKEALSNLFGSHRAKKGLAVFTTHTSDLFVKDIIRFCGYYLVRYSLSFLAPELKSHNDQGRKYCVFHKKINKTEITESLKSGKVCDDCNKVIRENTNQEINEAIVSLLKIISNQFPLSIVMKGGGVKGLAFAGALLELEKHFVFNCYAGTSAGAITAVLLGAGYKSEELLKILSEKDFNEFRDSFFPLTFFNLLFRKGLYPGDEIESWINSLLKIKIRDQISQIQLADLNHQTIVYASRKNDGTLEFDSHGKRKDHHAAFAARCSMSIPYFFTPKKVDGVRVYDGGLRNNFPLKEFIESNPQQPFIALYLLPSQGKSGFVINDLLNITVEGEERKIVDKYIDRVVLIDPHPIKTTDFDLNDSKKEYLVLSGRIAALNFILKYHPDISLYSIKLDELTKRKEELRPLLFEKSKKIISSDHKT